ncbi:transcriptional regulator [Muricauda sp. 334s03]|jgi:predicted ArsR family transcriptional regulator|uniref:Transcriptional regulator n=1 Tax=Flagellimonas yonaguniensis TaxID=3031325 RepID=A0ABT5Y2S1_9FLAO|nr:metalloregulator ArsR/SmtB family transcription factor [[Muricauda] yonaguniensis]MDF0717743.1 transcriptional regulator [[Muricauda] yonaguniensis]
MDKIIQENERALCILKNEGEKTLKDLAKMLCITTEGARFQLLKLANEGYVKSESRAKGRGRPQQFWSLTKEGHAKFPNKHSELTLRLINKIKEDFGEETLSKIITSTGKDNLDNYRKTIAETDTLEEKVQKLAQLREKEGYMATFEKTGDGHFELIENHCPICDAASICQKFCSSELSVFQAVFGPNIQVERVKHILAGDRRCTYLIKEKSNT